MKRKTRLTLLMALSEQQANSLAQCCGPTPVLLATLPQPEQRRIEALARRGMVHLIKIAPHDYLATLTTFGHTCAASYRAAEGAGLLREVA